MPAYGVIYITTNLVNGRRYIGSTTQLKKFFAGQYKGSGTSIKLAYKKYGLDNFVTEALEVCPSKVSLDQAEMRWIEYYNAAESLDFYNRTKLVDGGHFKSAEAKAKMAEKRRDYWQNSKEAKDHGAKTSKTWKTNNPQNLKRSTLRSPTGEIFEINGLHRFAAEHGLNASAICHVLKGTRRVHKGWTRP